MKRLFTALLLTALTLGCSPAADEPMESDPAVEDVQVDLPDDADGDIDAE